MKITVKEHLNQFKPDLRGIIFDLQKSGTRKIKLTIVFSIEEKKYRIYNL